MSVREPRMTQQQIEEYVKDEKDLRPWGGAGSVDFASATIGKKSRQPADARGRLHHRERAAFAEAHQEVTTLTPEEQQRINEAVSQNLKRDQFRRHFANAVRNGIALTEAWNKAGFPGECPFFNGVERDGDPAGAHPNLIRESMLIFADCPAFAPYRSTDKSSPRFQVQKQIVDLLWEFMVRNMVNMTRGQSWLTCFQLLQNIGLIPEPVKSEEELRAIAQAEADSAPADDGNPVARKEDETPVVYNLRGKRTRYSQQMLHALTAEGYATVMGLERANPNAIRLPRDFETHAPKDAESRPAADGNPVAYHDDGVTPIVYDGKRYSQRMLNAATSDEHLKIFRLTRNPRAQASPQPLK